jgi:hypothetical protein
MTHRRIGAFSPNLGDHEVFNNSRQALAWRAHLARQVRLRQTDMASARATGDQPGGSWLHEQRRPLKPLRIRVRGDKQYRTNNLAGHHHNQQWRST